MRPDSRGSRPVGVAMLTGAGVAAVVQGLNQGPADNAVLLFASWMGILFLPVLGVVELLRGSQVRVAFRVAVSCLASAATLLLTITLALYVGCDGGESMCGLGAVLVGGSLLLALVPVAAIAGGLGLGQVLSRPAGDDVSP